MTNRAQNSNTTGGGEERLVTSNPVSGDGAEESLRPKSLREFIGQATIRENLAVFIEATRGRGEALDHLLFSGPPGLGKTTLAQIVAAELSVNFRTTSGPILAKQGDLAAVLTNLEPRDVLFIDEIHRLNPAVEEILYPAMEDFQLDLIIGEGPAARSIRIDLPPFTLIGATTRSGLIATPLRDRFGIPLRLEFYSQEELQLVVERAARVFKIEITPGGASEIAKRSRGTPRISSRLLRRVRDFAAVDELSPIDDTVADMALSRLEVDEQGLDTIDRRYLSCLAKNYEGGPVGIETMGAALAEQRDVLEEVVEPFLIQQGLVQRTARGRMLSAHGWAYLGISVPKTVESQLELIEDIKG